MSPRLLRAGNELADQDRQSNPDDGRSCKPRCEFGDAAAPASREQRGCDRERALDQDEPQEVRIKRRCLRAENRLAERVAVEESRDGKKCCE